MAGSLISDAVNLGSRLESLTRYYGDTVLLTLVTLSRMENSRAFLTRLVSRVLVKGRQLAAKQTVGAPCSVPGAVITDPAEVRKILRHLLQIGRAPPGQASRLLRVALASRTVDCGVFQGHATGKSSSPGMLTAARRPSQPL
jgi:hypothetical protein